MRPTHAVTCACELCQYLRNEVTGVGSSRFRPSRNSSSIKNCASTRFAPEFRISTAAAAEVPPVASKSSTSTTRSPSLTASVCISTSASPYSNEYLAISVLYGSLPRLRIGTNPTPSSYATADPKTKPRASIPTILSISLPRQRSKNRSIDARNKLGSLNTGVMSLNVMPFFGKSGTLRTAARSLSTVSEAIGANASGLYSNVNQRCYGKARLNGPIAIAPDLQSKCVRRWCFDPEHGRGLCRIANWERQPTIGCPSGPLFSHCFNIL